MRTQGGGSAFERVLLTNLEDANDVSQLREAAGLAQLRDIGWRQQDNWGFAYSWNEKSE